MLDKLQLKPGETLRLEKTRTVGSHGQTDIETYSVINEQGEVVGTVIYTDTITINGLKKRQTLLHKDLNDKTVLDIRW